MKVILKVHSQDKPKVLRYALQSYHQKQLSDGIFLWYYLKQYAKEDAKELEKQGIKSEILTDK